MAFWTYMLHLNGGLFYVGHTDDLERRIAEHQCGAIPGFTSGFHRIALVWAEEFQTRDEAKAAEKRIKGWRKEKKLALIRATGMDCVRCHDRNGTSAGLRPGNLPPDCAG